MSDLSKFESRTGKVNSSPEKIYDFMTDLRNFEQFIPRGTVSNWHATNGSCTFSVSKVGNVDLKLHQKQEYDLVSYQGNALDKNKFELVVHINPTDDNSSVVKVEALAELNPLMKMMASTPIKQFLEMLVAAMENFKAWEKVTG
jgi:carbon monoxide dehydrogenase subunit G